MADINEGQGNVGILNNNSYSTSDITGGATGAIAGAENSSVNLVSAQQGVTSTVDNTAAINAIAGLTDQGLSLIQQSGTAALGQAGAAAGNLAPGLLGAGALSQGNNKLPIYIIGGLVVIGIIGFVVYAKGR